VNGFYNVKDYNLHEIANANENALYFNMLSNYISAIWTKSVVREKVVSLADVK
jgi:hypothetical protein